MKKFVWIGITILMIAALDPAHAQEKILAQFEQGGIWKLDRPNHRCLIDRGVWDRLPFEKKEEVLQMMYVEEKTWWKIYDRISGQLLGEVSSWGWKVYP